MEGGKGVRKLWKKEAKKGRWKVSVMNASLLEDNPRAGPVCFKSNQSIRINYPPPSTVQLALAHGPEEAGVLVVVGVRWGWRCVMLSLSLSRTHTPPTPQLFFFFLGEKESIKIKE